MMIIDDFVFFVETKGAFKGHKAVVLKFNNAGQKNQDLSISKHIQTEKTDNIIHIPIYQLNKDNPMDEHNVVHIYIKKLLPPSELLNNERVFPYKAQTKQITVSLIISF